MQIAYQDGDGRSTERVIQPFAVAYYVGATLICAWCELRNGVRHFRTDRVVSADVLDESFSIPETVIARWLAERQDDQPSATPAMRRRPRRQFGRHHSPYHVARSGLPWCHIDKLRIGVLSRLGESLQYPSRGHETRIGGGALAFARDGEDRTAYWEEQMPWRLWVAVSAGTFATKSLAIFWHSTYAIAENARSSQLLRLACPSKLNVPIFTLHGERPARGLAAQIAAIV